MHDTLGGMVGANYGSIVSCISLMTHVLLHSGGVLTLTVGHAVSA
jgi:hypothetical protein